MTKQAVPSTPATDKSEIYVDTNDLRLKQIDSNGVISVFNNDGLMDRNILTNPGFYIQQRVATASTAIPSVSTTTRAGQVADRWAVTTGNATSTLWAQVEAGAAPETGLLAKYYGRITQATNAAKLIFSQFLINADINHLRGLKVRLSIKLKQFVGSNQTYKLGLLQLTAAGTIDVCPQFISAIGASGVTPTFGTNLSLIAPDASPTGENGTINGNFLEVTSTAGWVRSSAVFTIPTDCKNLCLIVIKDATGGNTDSIGVAEFQMTQGPDIVDFIHPPLAEELMKCQRYFNKSFPLTTVPAVSLTVAAAGTGPASIIGKAGATALAVHIPIQFPIKMWKTPTVTLFTPTSTGAVPWRVDGTTPAAQTSAAQVGLTDTGVTITATGDANGAVGDLVSVHYVADAEFVA